MMSPEIVAAERHREVRAAARAWAAKGFLGAESRRVIEHRYPDDRVRLPVGLRILAFLLTTLAVVSAFGFMALIFRPGSNGAALLAAVFAVLCALATEFQRGPLRRAEAGAELATALLTLVFAAVAVFVSASDGTPPATITLGLVAIIALALASRWGSGVLGLLAAVLIFAWLAQFSAGRMLWLLVATAGTGPLLIASGHPALPPTQRTGCWCAAGISMLALYLAVNLVSFDEAWIENLRASRSADDPPLATQLRSIMVVATAAVPLVLIGFGFRRRHSLMLLAGLACLTASIATIRYYHPVMPLEYALVLAGVVMVFGALAVRRWLRRGPGGERLGWTADALFTDESRTAAVQAAIGAASFTPAPTTTRTEPSPVDLRGDGRFGGGGAGGRY